MNDPAKRCRELHRLAKRIASSADALTTALVQDANITFRAANTADIPMASFLLRCFSVERALPLDPSICSGARVPLGGIGVDLPLWSPLTTLARTLASAFAAGNRQVFLNLHPCFERLEQILEDLLAPLPGVVVQRQSSNAFLASSLEDPYMHAVFVSGSHKGPDVTFDI